MISGSGSATCDLVLVGGGHSHVEVLRQFALRPAPTAACRLFHNEVIGLDLTAKRVICADRPPVEA